MASRAYHHNKKTGVTYVYSVESYWDKEKKAPRNKQTCIGKLDPATGEINPSSRKRKESAKGLANDDFSVSAKVTGPYSLLSTVAQETGLESCVKKAFPELHNEIMSMVHFIAHKGLPLSRCESWSQTHLHPAAEAICSQRISEWLAKINEGGRQRFFSLWMAKMAAADCLCYDITSVSSYATANEYVRRGYNRDGEPLPQINLALLFGQESALPVFYRRMPGNISDVGTLKTTMKSLDYLGIKSVRFVLDRGFYSRPNIDALLSKRHHFTIAVPTNRKWVLERLDLHCDTVMASTNYHQVNDDEALYMTTELMSWGEDKRRAYLHIYYNAARAAEDYDRFTRKLLRLKQAMEAGRLSDREADECARFFIVTNTPKRGLKIVFNEPEIQKYRKRYAGFFCIMSTHIKDRQEALSVYRRKDAVENCFDDLKNQLDMKRLRVHGSPIMDSRLFVQFLALIVISAIRKTAQSDHTLKNMTIREIMETMETLVQIKYATRYGQVITEAGPVQRKIIDAFKLNLLS
jgi:transposase